MNQRNTLILLGVFALLVGVLIYRQRTAGTEQTAPPGPPASTGLLWESLSAEDIVAIKLTDHETDERMELRQNQGIWAVFQPTSELADPIKATTAATQLAGINLTRALTETTELDDFGVLNPHYTFEVEKWNGESLIVDIGGKTPVGNGYYALRQGDEYAVIVNGFTVDALTPLISEPPYKPTPTPEPTAESEPTPS